MCVSSLEFAFGATSFLRGKPIVLLASESQLRSVLRTGLAYTDKLRIFFVLDR